MTDGHSGRGKGLGKELGKGIGKSKHPGAKRHRKILRENIMGVTRPAIRRIARRGGVKRISEGIYTEARSALQDWLRAVLHDVACYVDLRFAKTVTTLDVIYALKRRGTPIYGFDPNFKEDPKRLRAPGQGRGQGRLRYHTPPQY